ncbi:MAG: dihydroorotate dehydrogenase electron transfer subunit [Promethearchaeota archaeon]|nr:MAG: dihydroorotate dehydrogenase electron transfer subunit [Candidatus Lokiarchaeota archaeon]
MPITPNHDYRLNRPYQTPILEIVDESPRVKTFRVKYDPIPESIQIKPGQFVMVWIPGVDEIPMSVSRVTEDGSLSISVAIVGDATQALSYLQVGDNIGIRGPYGNWYLPRKGIAVILGGGIGMASVLPLVYECKDLEKRDSEPQIDRVICIEGAQTESQLIYIEELKKVLGSGSNANLYLCTDDGTLGFKGFATVILEEVIQNILQLSLDQSTSSPITVYACGPEIMLKKVVDLCLTHHIEVQVSLERMMRCGFGICGLCALEPTGLLVCRDGPIFQGKSLVDCTDFGKFHRDLSGKPYFI